MIAGLYGALATLIAIRSRDAVNGSGQVIDLSLFEPIFSVLGPLAANYVMSGEAPERVGSRSEVTAPRNVYRCKDDKFVALSASMQSMAERLFKTIGRPDLIDDPRFKTNSDRVANNDVLDPIVAAFMAQHTQEENLRIFERTGVTVGPVCNIEQLMAHPFIKGREVLVSYPDEQMGELPMHNVVPRLGGTPGAIRTPAPALGQHTSELLIELGYSEHDIEALAVSGVV